MKKIIFASIVAGSMLYAVPSLTLSDDSVKNNVHTKTKKSSSSVTRGDVKIIEATESIRLISQQMAKDYLFLFKTPHPEEVKQRLKQSLIELAENLRIIGTTTKDADTKDILEFLSYSKDQIAQIFTEKVTPEQAALMMDYSETLLEGADSIAAAHAYDFTKEEHMLIITKKMEYLIERMMKYYIALHVGFDTVTNRKQMQMAVEKFDANMQQIEAYEYPKEVRQVKKEIVRSWQANKRFLSRWESLFIPKLMLMSTYSIEKLTEQIALYHNKNL